METPEAFNQRQEDFNQKGYRQFWKDLGYYTLLLSMGLGAIYFICIR